MGWAVRLIGTELFNYAIGYFMFSRKKKQNVKDVLANIQGVSKRITLFKIEPFSISLFLSFLDSYSNNFGHFLNLHELGYQKMSKIIIVAVLEAEK